MAFRLFVRVRERLWGWDDAFVVLAGVSSVSGDILVCMSMDSYHRVVSALIYTYSATRWTRPTSLDSQFW